MASTMALRESARSGPRISSTWESSPSGSYYLGGIAVREPAASVAAHL